MVNKEIEEKAKYLASQPYTMGILVDRTTSGESIYLAKNPDLEGCMAQGATIQEALTNLVDARLEYMESLLGDGMPIPQVTLPSISTEGETEAVYQIEETVPVHMEEGFLTDLDRAIQPEARELRMKIQPTLTN